MQIHSNGLGEIKIGDDYSKVIKYCSRLKFRAVQKGQEESDEYNRGLFISKDSALVCVIGNKNWGASPYVVRMIESISIYDSNG